MACLAAGWEAPMVTEARTMLEVRGLRKAFGAVTATDGVDLELVEGALHALDAPNGAGRPTLMAQLCGELRPDAASIVRAGEDVRRLLAFARARKGLSH